MKTVIVDIMGGDKAPLETVKGAALAKAELGDGISYILVGDKAQIESVAADNGIDLSGFEIVHAESTVTMDDDPMSVARGNKTDSSMAVSLKLLKEGRGDAMVSTGNTGALFTGATLIVRKIKGVKRPAIAALLPLDPPVLLLDSGANVVATPEYLEQFALMGSAYMKNLMGVESPRVGLLNNGAEEHKGTELQIETYKRLKSNEGINFVGNVEGNAAVGGACDVLVTDGFTGNVFLKTLEGFGKMILKTLKTTIYKNLKTKIAGVLIKKDLSGMRKNFDSSELGGAPILGINKPVIKAHGSSDAKAFKNAIRQAVAFSEAPINDEIAAAVAKAKSEADPEE